MNFLNLFKLILLIFSLVLFFFAFFKLAIIHFLIFILLTLKDLIANKKINLKRFFLFFLIITIFILTNYYSSNLKYNLDLTEEKIYSLNKNEKEIVDKVKEDIKIYLISSRFNKTIRETEKLLEPFINYDSKISYAIINKDKNKEIFNKYKLDPQLKGVIATNNKFSLLKRGSKSEILASFISLSNKKQARALYLSGHSEPELNSDTKNGLSYFKEKLKINGLETESILLSTTSKINDDVDLLIINNPKTELSDHEINLVRLFLESGKNLILFTEPDTTKSINKILNPYGLKFNHEVIKQNDNRITNGREFQFLVNLKANHAITRNFKGNDFFFVNYASFFTREGKNSDRRTYKSLITTPSSAYSDNKIKFSPFDVGIAFNGVKFIDKSDTNWLNSNTQKTKILCFSDNNFIENRYINSFSHKRLVKNSILWLLDKNITNYNTSKTEDSLSLISLNTFNLTLLINIILIELMFIIGAIVFFK